MGVMKKSLGVIGVGLVTIFSGVQSQAQSMAERELKVEEIHHWDIDADGGALSGNGETREEIRRLAIGGWRSREGTIGPSHCCEQDVNYRVECAETRAQRVARDRRDIIENYIAVKLVARGNTGDCPFGICEFRDGDLLFQGRLQSNVHFDVQIPTGTGVRTEDADFRSTEYDRQKEAADISKKRLFPDDEQC